MVTVAQLDTVLTKISRAQMRDCALEFRRAVANHQYGRAAVWMEFAVYHRAASREGLTGEPIPQELLRAVDDIVKSLGRCVQEAACFVRKDDRNEAGARRGRRPKWSDWEIEIPGA